MPQQNCTQEEAAAGSACREEAGCKAGEQQCSGARAADLAGDRKEQPRNPGVARGCAGSWGGEGGTSRRKHGASRGRGDRAHCGRRPSRAVCLRSAHVGGMRLVTGHLGGERARGASRATATGCPSDAGMTTPAARITCCRRPPIRSHPTRRTHRLWMCERVCCCRLGAQSSKQGRESRGGRAGRRHGGKHAWPPLPPAHAQVRGLPGLGA